MNPDVAPVLDEAVLRGALRRSRPSADVASSLELLDRLETVVATHTDARRLTEDLLGLRTGEVEVLRAVADGAGHHRSVARRTGQVDAAAAATVEVLVGRGLLARHHDRRAGTGRAPALVHLTAAGQVALQQYEALQLRLADAVLGTLEDHQAVGLREALGHLAAALERGEAGPERLRLLPQ